MHKYPLYNLLSRKEEVQETGMGGPLFYAGKYTLCLAIYANVFWFK